MRLAFAGREEAGAVVFPHRPDSDAEDQRRLALSLIDSVGFDGAVRYCRNNSWDGVLRAMFALPPAARMQ